MASAPTPQRQNRRRAPRGAPQGSSAYEAWLRQESGAQKPEDSSSYEQWLRRVTDGSGPAR